MILDTYKSDYDTNGKLMVVVTNMQYEVDIIWEHLEESITPSAEETILTSHKMQRKCSLHPNYSVFFILISNHRSSIAHLHSSSVLSPPIVSYISSKLGLLLRLVRTVERDRQG